MCVKCKDRVFYDQTKKQFYIQDETCGKLYIGAPQTTPGNTSGQTPLDEWLESGEPPVAPGAEVPHDNPLYKTMDSLKCAKATTIVNEIWNVLTLHDALQTASTLSAPSGAIALIAAAILPLSWAAAVEGLIANTIFQAALGIGLDDTAEALESVFNDSYSKDQLICDLVDRMVAPKKIGAITLNRMTSEDVKIALERFEEIVPHEPIVRTILGIFPIEGWIEVTQFKVMETECACADYTPEVPVDNPPPAGTFKVYSYKLTRYAQVGNNTPGTVAEVLALEPSYGVKVNDSLIRTESSNGYSNFGYTEQAVAGVLCEFSEDVQLMGIHLDFQYISPRAGAVNGQYMQWRILTAKTGDVNWTGAQFYDALGAGGNDLANMGFHYLYEGNVMNGTEHAVRYVWISLGVGTFMGGTIPVGELVGIRFTAKGDVGSPIQYGIVPGVNYPK